MSGDHCFLTIRPTKSGKPDTFPGPSFQRSTTSARLHSAETCTNRLRAAHNKQNLPTRHDLLLRRYYTN